MQSQYIGKLMELADKDARVMHLIADSGTGFDEMFRRNFPNQMYNFGIAEENMVAAAAGLAMTGKIPFVYTAGAFLVYRALEFIRDDICFQNLNVKIIGMGSGLAWSTLGPTHHTTEEIGILRSIPNLRILSPASPKEVAACVQLAYEYDGPVYIRIGMNHEREYFEDNHEVWFGKNEVLKEGTDVAIFTTGSIAQEAITAAELVEESGLNVSVINMVSLKPIDEQSIVSVCKSVKHIVTLEEHNVIGGIGSIVSDVLVDNQVSVDLKRIGLRDCFAKGYGTHEQLRRHNGLDAQSVADAIRGMCDE